MQQSEVKKLIGVLPAPIAAAIEPSLKELTGEIVEYSQRIRDLKRVRAQWQGPPAATSETYHPDQYGLQRSQQEYFRKVLARSHVNLVEPALDRLVNSIHAGKITRRVADGLDPLAAALASRAHAGAMSRFCENAFGYGTGYLVPLSVDDEIRYWLPDPISTVLIVDPTDVSEVLGIVEPFADATGEALGLRFVFSGATGRVTLVDRRPVLEMTENDFPFPPLVIAYGREQTHFGSKYGRSYVLGVADAAIRVTNNEVNLELLRDRQTQALLVLIGEFIRSSADDQGTNAGKYVQFPLNGGSAEFKTPESRLEEVIALTKRFCADAAVSSGLPLDTFLPEVIAGADASATAARIRAFPLQQRMTRLVEDWAAVEERTAVVLGAVMLAADGAPSGRSLSELRALIQPSVSIKPSLPEADSETLANWQQRIAAFLSPIEEAIEFYGEGLTEEQKRNLIRSWTYKNDPLRWAEMNPTPAQSEGELNREQPGEMPATDNGETPVEITDGTE